MPETVRSPRATHERHRFENRMPGDHFTNCPVLERTGNGVPCGRCCFFLPDGRTCPRHGDVFLFEPRGGADA